MGVRPFHHQTILVKFFAHPMMTLIMLSTTNPSNHEPVRNLYMNLGTELPQQLELLL